MAARKKYNILITVTSSRNPNHLLAVFENLVRQQSSIDYLDNWLVGISAANTAEAAATNRQQAKPEKRPVNVGYYNY